MKLNSLSKIPKKILVIIGLFLLLSYFLNYWANKPLTTSFKNGSTDTPSTALTTPGATVTSPYFSTILPSNLTIKSHNTNPKGFAHEQLLATDITGQKNDQLGITIADLPNDGLETVSDVIFRTRATDLYDRVQLEWAPAGVIAFQKKDSYEYSVFWAKSNLYASIVVSGGIERGTVLDSILSQVLRSWRWQ